MFFYSWKFENSTKISILADPQMEGDMRVKNQGLYGKINNIMNDYYFKHIILNIQRYLSPEFIFVLGDLFSSQRLSDQEFQNRLQRYNFIFESVNFFKFTF